MSSFDRVIAQRALSERTGEPLRACSVCDRLLTDMDYFTIAKAFSKGKAILEALQCFSCQMSSKSYASEQSIENIMLYSGRRFNEFLQDNIRRKVYHLEEPSCLITGEELQFSDSFELYTFNMPGAGLEEHDYVLVGPTAAEQMTELLSKETRESWGRYTDQLTPDTPNIVVSPMFIA